jgi:hypothetical protein
MPRCLCLDSLGLHDLALRIRKSVRRLTGADRDPDAARACLCTFVIASAIAK